MRVIIELTDEEARSTTISRQTVDRRSEGETERQGERQEEQRAIPTSDGGAPSDALVSALGSGTFAGGGDIGPAGDGGAVAGLDNGISNAGEPTSWMSIALGENGG